ncbi:hypothetical protein UFOVP1244_3 [uncultured Caudovirales phage]|uniref:Uncharacterized protein n=1 Tax=uncultured Caudovirales phage TaxID=2100421 RepID=A0A6J5RK70_9CAUD|nr:hypothetical protein UFOVP1244_3 [uncultured Caudovirales phage]
MTVDIESIIEKHLKERGVLIPKTDELFIVADIIEAVVQAAVVENIAETVAKHAEEHLLKVLKETLPIIGSAVEIRVKDVLRQSRPPIAELHADLRELIHRLPKPGINDPADDWRPGEPAAPEHFSPVRTEATRSRGFWSRFFFEDVPSS